MIAYALIVVLAYLATRSTNTLGDVLVVAAAIVLVSSFWTLKQIAVTACAEVVRVHNWIRNGGQS